jgi:hypothetical protein
MLFAKVYVPDKYGILTDWHGLATVCIGKNFET